MYVNMQIRWLVIGICIGILASNILLGNLHLQLHSAMHVAAWDRELPDALSNRSHHHEQKSEQLMTDWVRPGGGGDEALHQGK